MTDRAALVVMKPFAYDDRDTGDHIELSVSERYSMLTINKRTYYFIRETGEFDGFADEGMTGPALIYARE